MEKRTNLQKILLMGKSEVGKTSMYSIIFANYLKHETKSIGYTTGLQENKIKFIGDLNFDLWDCAGQEKLMKRWFEEEKEKIFTNVSVLIYVFDIEFDNKEDLQDYHKCLKLLQKLSPQSKIFILIHKSDKIQDPKIRIDIFNEKKNQIIDQTQQYKDITLKDVFCTTIWNESLYFAWSQITQNLLPNLGKITQNLKAVCEVSDCDEVILFEKSSFLIISYYKMNKSNEQNEIIRNETISNIIKQFKLTCNHKSANLKSLKIKTSAYTAHINEFTDSTYIMLICKQVQDITETIQFNLRQAKTVFHTLV